MTNSEYLERDTPVVVDNKPAKIADLYYKPNGKAVYSVIFKGDLLPKGKYEREQIEVL